MTQPSLKTFDFAPSSLGSDLFCCYRIFADTAQQSPKTKTNMKHVSEISNTFQES